MKETWLIGEKEHYKIFIRVKLTVVAPIIRLRSSEGKVTDRDENLRVQHEVSKCDYYRKFGGTHVTTLRQEDTVQNIKNKSTGSDAAHEGRRLAQTHGPDASLHLCSNIAWKPIFISTPSSRLTHKKGGMNLDLKLRSVSLTRMACGVLKKIFR